MADINKLKTPEEFIEYYWEQLQDYFANRNLQVSKVGFIGFFLNILGFTQYDIQQYYNFLFKESLPVTADTTKSLYFHSSLYGYVPPLATPASLKGEFELILSTLPQRTNDIVRREIHFEDINFNINNIEYILRSKYTIEETNGVNYLASIYTEDGRYITTGFSSVSAKLPIIDLDQITIQEIEFKTPNYQYGTYFIKRIPIKDNQLYKVEVYVDDTPFDIEFTKFVSSPDDNTVFIRYIEDSILLETGSGIHGKYIPNSNIKVILYLTKGSLGNINKGIYTPSSGRVTVIDYLTNGQTSPPYSIDASYFIRANVLYGEGGKDLLDADSIKQRLIEYVRHRQNLVSENDFRNIYSYYQTDFELLFKKIDIRDNHIYNHFILYDQYMVPYYMDTVSPVSTEIVPDTTINNKKIYIFPEFDINNEPFISPFLYIYDEQLKLYLGYILYPEISMYFDKLQMLVENLTLPPLSFSIEFDTDHFNIYIKSYQNIDEYFISVECPQLNINSPMNRRDTNTKQLEIPFFIDNIDLIFSITYYGTNVAIAEINNISPVSDISDYLTIKEYIPDFINLKQQIEYNGQTITYFRDPEPNEIYLVSFPVIKRDQFLNDRDRIISKISTLLSNIFSPGNRMISDDIQIRFMNTYYIPGTLLENLTVQGYTFDLVLPLKLKVEIYVSKEYIYTHDNDITNEINSLTLELAQLLKDKYTGTKISFYRTQLVDYLHNYDWVKHCMIRVYDSIGTEIPYADIETKPNFFVLKEIKDKFKGTTFTPVYWYWDLNNIDISYYTE